MAGLGTGAPIVKVYHEKSMILPDVSRVLACLYEKDIEFERHTASYKSLLRLQASSHAPVPFYDGPTFLEESREICRYIAETYEHQGYPFLLGKDSLERSSIEQWLHHEEHAFNPPSRSLFCHLAFPLAEEDDDIELQKEKLEEVLDVYEQRLGDSEFLAGNKFTLADLVHLPNSQYITDSDKFVYLYDSRKNVQRWWNDISTRDSWQKVLKDIQVVEQQRKQEELEKQQQRKWRREHPPTLRRPTRLDSRMHTSTKSQTILVRPPLGIGSTSPEASQADKPLPTETSPDETLLPPPAAHKSSAVQSKHTTIFTTHRETPPAPVQSTPRLPGYSHIPVQSTSSTPATSPTTAEIPSRTGADKPEIRGVSLPSEATEIDLPANSKRSSSKEVSHNLRVYSFYEASSHTDEAEPYVEPTPQEPSEMLDRISETDGPSNATDHVKTSPRSAKEDSGASGFWTDNTATNADALDKKSVQYNEHTPQRPVEPIYGGSTDQRATYTSPGKHGSTEAHQKLQTEQWHGTAAGLSNLKGETDYLRPTQQVDPGKDVQHSSSQDSEQVSTYPPAQEPVSMDRQRVQGPEMTTRKPYTDQKRDVPSMLWPKTADVRGIAEEDKASSDHRDAVLPPYAGNRAEEAKIVSADHRKDASPPKHVKDEDTHDIAQEARETVSAPRRRRPQDAYDTSEGIGPYHSSSSRPQPINVPQDAAPPAKQAVPQGPRRVTAPYPAAQEFIKQARESPASRSTEPHDAQGRTEEETVESSSSKDHLLNSRLADARPPKEFKDEDSYGSVPPVRTGYADDTYNRERDRDAPPKRIMSQDAFEETEMTDSTSFEAQTFGHQRADAPPQKQRPPEDPQTTASPLKKRYSGGEDTTEQSKPSASRPRRMAAQETQYNLDETKARDSRSTREQPSDTWQASAPLPRHEADDVHSTTSPSQKRYPGTRGTIKEVEDITPMPRRMAGEDANGTLEETKFAESASSQPQPLYYNRNGAPSREDRLGATSPLERRYADAEDTTKHSRDTASKPRKIMGQDAEDTSEETEAHNSALFRAQPQDPRRVATTPSKQAAEDALSVSRPSPKRYPRVEETSKQPRPAASKPTHIAAQDARDVFRESKVADSTPSIEKPSDARVAAPFQKQEIPDVRNTSASFEKRYPDVKGATKKSKVTFEETESPDSASSRVQPSDSQRDYAPSWKKEAREAPHATAPLKKRDSDVEDTANHSDGAIKPRQMVGQDAQGTYEETKASDSGLLREQSSDAWQPETTPREKVATEDGSERNVSNDEDITTQPKGTASAPRQTIAGDASGAFQESKPADSVSSREQPLSARQPVVTPSRQETGDSLSKISAFHKTRPFVEDITRPAVDTVFGPRQIGAKDTKDITVEKKVADSASSVRARPTYTPRTARPLSEQAEEEEDARDKDRERRETISAPKKMASRDGEHTHGGRKIPHSASREQYLDNLQANSPLKQAAAEDPRGAIRGAKEPLVDETKHSQGVKGASKKSVGTFEERKDPASALPTAHPLSAQDAQHIDRSSRTPTADQQKDASTHIRSNIQDTYQEARSPSARQKGLGSSPSPSPLQAEAGDDDQDIIGEKVFSSEQLRKMLKESQSTSSKAQPADSRSPTKVERTPSVYQEDHLVAPDSHGQPQTLPTGVRADGSTAKRQQAPVVPSSSEEKSNPPTPPRAKVHDDHTTEEPFKRGTVDDPKGAPPLLGRELTSQVQRATERTPDGNMSSKLSTIDQWQRTSAPIQGVTPNSGDDVPGVSTIDQKPTPMSQQSIPSAQSANEMVKRKQRMVPSAPAGAQTPDDQHAPPSLAGADMAERDGEPVQMQAPALHARPTSVPTRRATPEARDAGDNEFANTSDAQRWKALKAKHDSAMINEDDRDASLSTHDATGDKKTAWHASEAQVSDTAPGSTATPVNVRPTSGDKLVQRFSRDQGIKPPESTQAETPLDAPSDSVSTQGVPTDALDKTKFAKASSTEDMRPTAGPASTLEAQLAEHKFSPSDKKSHAAQPQSSVESRKEDTSVSAADQTKKPQTIFRQQARPSTPITKLIPSSNANHDERKIQQANLDNLPTDDSPTPHVQVAHAPQTIPSYRDMTPAPGTRDSPASNAQIASAKFQEAVPDNYRPDELTVPSVSSEKQGSYAGSPTEPHERPSHDAHGAADDKDTTKYPSKQAPVLQYRPDSTSADSYVRPTSGDEPGISPDQGAESPAAAQATNSENRRNEVFPAEKKFVPSDQDSVHSVQQPFPAETRRGETIVAAAEKTMPTNIGQQNTQDTREAPTSNFMPAEDIPSDARSGRPDEVPLAEQKFASSDQDTQLTSSVEPRNEEIRNSTRSVQPLFSAADDQTNDPQTTIGQQDTAPTPGTSKSPSSETHHASGQFQEVAPDDHHTVESLPSEERVSRTKPSSVLSAGPTHDYLDLDKKITKVPSSQAQRSDPKPDPKQNRSDEPPTRFLPSQLPEQRAETQALPPLVGSYGSKSSKDVTSDTLGKAKSLKPSSIDQEAMGSALTPDTHLGSAPGEVAPAGQKLLFKDQDSAHPTQGYSSSEPTKEQSAVTAPNEAKTSTTLFNQQDIGLAQTKMKDPSSGSQYGSQRLQDITPKDQRITGPIPMQQQVPRFEHISKQQVPDQSITPSEPLPVVESRKESTGAEAERKVYQPVTGQRDIRHAPGISEHVLDDDHNKEPVSRKEQVSHEHASEPREGSPPDVHGASLDKKRTPPSSRARSSDPKRDALPKSVDVNPSSGQQSTTKSLHALTRSPPLHESPLFPESNEDIPESFKPPSPNQEVTSPKVVPASAPGTILGTASNEIAPDGKKIPLSARDLARSVQRPFSVESTKDVASSDQMNEARTIIGQGGVTPSTDKEKTPFDLQASELAKAPNEDQEQVHSGSAYEQREGPTGDARGTVDEKMPHPSSQAENSDIAPDSALISSDAHGTSIDGPTTSSRDSEAQPPTGTQIVPALFLEKIESPTPPSTDEELMTPMTSPAPALEAPQDQDLTTSQLSPSVVSRKDVADQTNVSQAGLRKPASSDSTRPSEKIQEFSPDAYLTKSEKSLLPMKGADPVQPPYEASLDLSSDEKTTMIKGDQANTISNVSLSASQEVGQPEDSAVKRPLSEESVSSSSQKNLERTSPEEKSKQQEQIDQSSTISSNDDSIEARRTANPNILTRSGDIQQSQSMQEAQGFRNQQQAEQAVFQSTQKNEMQIQETEAQDNGSDEPEEIRPDSAPISGTSSDGPATSSLGDSLLQPPAGTLNVPAVFLEKIESPRRPSTDPEAMAPMTSPALTADTLQDEDSTQSPELSPSVVSRKGVADANQTDVPQAGLRVPGSSDSTVPSEKIQEFSPDASLTKSAKPLLPMTGSGPVRPPHEASSDLSSDGKPTMIKGEQANTVSNVSFSASQPVGQSENSAVKRPLSEDSVSLFSQKDLERTLPAEKSKQKQQTDQSSIRSSKDDSIEASGVASPNILTTSGDIQPSLPKESMQAAQGSRSQQQAGQGVFQPIQDNKKQIAETEAQDDGSYEPKETRPDSALISGDAHRTSDDGPATSSSRDSRAQPPAGTLNAPAVFLENIESPRPLSADQEPMTSTTSRTAPDALQDQDSTPPQLSSSVVSRKDVANADRTNVSQAGLRQPATSNVTRPSKNGQEYSPDAYLTKSEKPLLPMEGSNPVQTPHEASFDLSSDEKPTMIKGEQANTTSNVSLSASQPVGQSENSAVKGPLSGDLVSSFSQKNLERTLPEEKLKQQPQTEQSSTRSSKDDSIQASGITSPNMLTTSGDIQPSPPKESMQAAQGSRNQQQAGQAVLQSVQDNEKQIEETEAQDNGSYEPKEIKPDSAPTSGDARRTSDDGPATSSSRDSWAQPPAETLIVPAIVPAVFLENIDSPRPPSTDQEPMTPMTSPAPAPDAPQDQNSTQSQQLSPSVVSKKDVANADQTNVPQAGLRELTSSDATRPSEEIQGFSLTKSAKPLLPMTGTNPGQPQHEASVDLSSNGKPSMIKGDQANTISNVSLSASQAVGQSENSEVKGLLSEDLVSPFSQKNYERTSPEEKSNQQQQTDQSNTRPSKGDSVVETRGTTDPDISKSGDAQPSRLKESTQAAKGSRDQQPADQDVFESTLDDEKQFEETEARFIGPDELYETNLKQSTDQMNIGASQSDASEQPGELVPAVQPRSNDTNIGSKLTTDAPGSVQADKKSDSSSRTSEEPEKQVQNEDRTRGGETKAPASKTELPEERNLPSRNGSEDADSGELDGSTDDPKSADTDNKHPPS